MHHTDMEITLKTPLHKVRRFVVPAKLGRKLEAMLREELGEDDEPSIPAEVVFPELLDPVKRPATVLRGLRYREGFTQAKLAKKLGIHQHHLSEMENGKRAISKAMAKDIAAALNANYRILL